MPLNHDKREAAAAGLTVRLAMIAGARRDVAESGVDGVSFAAFQGAAILVTCSFAFLSASYAFYRLFEGEKYALGLAIGIGLLWSIFIFLLDSMLVRTIDKLGSMPWIQIVSRLALGVALGLTISTPLELRLCEPLIDGRIGDDRDAKVDAARGRNAELESVPTAITDHEQDLNDLNQQGTVLQNWKTSPEARAADAAEKAYAQAVSRRGTYNSQHPSGSPQDPQRISLRLAVQETWRAKRDAIARLQAWQEDQTRIRSNLQQQETRSRLQVKAARERSSLRNQSSEADWTGIMRPQLIRQFLTFRTLENDPKYPQAGELRLISWATSLLFCVVELLPITLKLMANATPLDHLNAVRRKRDERSIALDGNLFELQQTQAAKTESIKLEAQATMDQERIAAAAKLKIEQDRFASETAVAELRAESLLRSRQRVEEEATAQIKSDREDLERNLRLAAAEQAAIALQELQLQASEERLDQIRTVTIKKEDRAEMQVELLAQVSRAA